MGIHKNEIFDLLASNGIFGPGSKELARHERHLTRYFEREYKRLSDNPVTLQSLGVSTESGPMMEDTEDLMANHYDKQLEFFASFLDRKYKAYSMAYYGDTPEAIRTSTTTLEEAQRAKFGLIAERAGIKGHERILDIGCGFGSLETYLLDKFPNVEVVGITSSSVQAEYLRQRIKKSSDPLSKGNFALIEGNFDKMPLVKLGKYNIVISIAVFEQIYNMRSIHERISKLVAPYGKSFHHFITSKITIPQFTDPYKTKIGTYFPGGRVWPHDEFTRHTDHFDLVDKWFINGLNYWRTLDEWHNRYWCNIPTLYKSVFDLKAIAHWNEYFSLCKAVFAPMEGAFYGNSHYLFRKPG